MIIGERDVTAQLLRCVVLEGGRCGPYRPCNLEAAATALVLRRRIGC
jgi:hypothetical protein